MRLHPDLSGILIILYEIFLEFDNLVEQGSSASKALPQIFNWNN